MWSSATAMSIPAARPAAPPPGTRASSSASTPRQPRAPSPPQPPVRTRREWLSGGVAGALVLQLVEAGCAPAPATAFPLASLGGVKKIADNKTRDLTMEQIKDVLEKDLRDRQYFVTGNLTREIRRRRQLQVHRPHR
mmetsp:Transcript_7804/g.12303  ORF Transcript_7804/g.12303 Transcript_7804/m.12303 type:complete len:137 (+) Transcript_7804:18-428(+)